MPQKALKNTFTVVISSTARDLPDHREQVMAACLQQDLLPRMMEHLPANDDDAIAASLKMVDEADVYLGVFAHRYGYVPSGHEVSITQMEYERAVERGIPRLIFLMGDDHPIKAGDMETGDGLAKLQAFKALLETNQVVSYFDSPADLRAEAVHSLAEVKRRLVEQAMAGASPAEAMPEGVVLRTLLVSDLPGKHALIEQAGDGRAAELFERHDQRARELLAEHGGREIEKVDGFLVLFERPWNAVAYALAYHEAVQELSRAEGVELAARVGIHLGEVVLRRNPPEDVARGAKPLEIEGLAKPLALRLLSLARERQTLLTRGAFDLARRGAVGQAAAGEQLRWLAHGGYLLESVPEPLEVFEVGTEALAPLEAPAGTDKVKRVLGQDEILGWRPAPGLEVPQRPRWLVERKLGEGGFGEVWLARHEKSRDRRVFKFCYEAARLRSLQREITLFRLLKEELGDRDDIARILDWNFDEAPYFVESEYTPGGDLAQWCEEQGGVAEVPLDVRLEIVAQVATALSAAHSVGVLHKDIKPTNVLITTDREGGPRAQLTDFGVGAVVERERLAAAGITVLGLTAKSEEQSSSYSGTRLYMAPEVLEGKTATLQADVYALGVMLYQMVVGDLTRALAPGWRRDVEDELLREDIAFAVDGSPEQRLGNALRIAERVRSLANRRQEREAEQREREQARRAREALAKSRKRLKLVAVAVGVLAVFGGAMAYQASRIAEEAETARQVSGFLVELFKVSDPDEALGNTITAREILDRGAKKIDRELRDQPEVQARLMHIIGVVYQSLGLYDASHSLLERALATRRQLHGAHHLDVVESLSVLASLANQRGKFEEAEKLSRESLKLRRSLLGEKHPDVAKDLEILANALADQSDFESAELYCREAVEIRRRSLDEADPNVASSLSLLAELLFVRGDHEEAEALYREGLALRRQVLGEAHSDIAASLTDLAYLLKARGAYEEAESLYREALEMRRGLLGGEHPDIADSLSTLGELLQVKGNYEEAETLFREALEMCRRLLGDEHPRVAVSMNNLALVLKKKGDYIGAEMFYRQSLAMSRRLLGTDHINVASSMANLALLYQEQGSHEEAEPLLREALDMVRRQLGDNHPWVASAVSHLAVSLQAEGDYEAAEKLFRESLEIRRQLLGAEHPHVALSLSRLARLLHVKGDHEDAEPLFREALSMRRRMLGGEHPEVAESLNDLARFLIDQGSFANAESMAREALAIFGKKLPADHWQIVNAKGVLGACLSGLGRYPEAEVLLTESYPILKELKGEHSWYAQDLLQHLVTLYEAWGKIGKAEECRARLP